MGAAPRAVFLATSSTIGPGTTLGDFSLSKLVKQSKLLRYLLVFSICSFFNDSVWAWF